jgi:hypothetical protein
MNRSAWTWPLRRFGSPAALLLALVLFPLPWVEVQCNRPIGDSGSRVLAQQSGLQAAYGGYTENLFVQEARSGRATFSLPPGLRKQEVTVSKSGWMILYALVLIGGVAAGLAVRRQALRAVLLLACSAAAGAVLFIQARAGFPLEQAVPNNVTAGVSLGDVFRMETSTPTALQTHYTGWFWLSVGTLAVAVAVTCWQLGSPRGSARPGIRMP